LPGRAIGLAGRANRAGAVLYTPFEQGEKLPRAAGSGGQDIVAAMAAP